MNLLALPDELLDSVIKHTIKICRRDPHGQLKQIRLVCHRLAHLHSVLSILFERIQLIGDIEDAEHLTPEKFAASGIARFVRHVTFLPPLHVPMTFGEFQDVFKSQVREEYGAYHPSRIPRERMAGTSLWREPAKEPILHSNEEMLAGWEDYRYAAERSLHYVEGDGMRRSWCRILSQLTKCSSFEFGLVDHNYIGLDLKPLRPECVSSPHHERGAGRTKCKLDRMIELSNTFIKAVIHTMSEAGCKPEALVFRQAYEPFATWDEAYDLQQLDVSRLCNLTIEPMVQRQKQGFPLSVPLAEQASMSHHNTYDLLSRSALTLETLRCGFDLMHLYKGVTPIPLPRLRSIVTVGASVPASFFRQWLAVLPRLEHMELDPNVSGSEVKPVLDAIRNKTSLRTGTIDFCTLEGEFRCTFDKDAPLTASDEQDIADAIAGDERFSEFMEYDNLIRLYICGHIEWTQQLEELP